MLSGYRGEKYNQLEVLFFAYFIIKCIAVIYVALAAFIDVNVVEKKLFAAIMLPAHHPFPETPHSTTTTKWHSKCNKTPSLKVDFHQIESLITV